MEVLWLRDKDCGREDAGDGFVSRQACNRSTSEEQLEDTLDMRVGI
jgi:hypothetical protein